MQCYCIISQYLCKVRASLSTVVPPATTSWHLYMLPLSDRSTVTLDLETLPTVLSPHDVMCTCLHACMYYVIAQPSNVSIVRLCNIFDRRLDNNSVLDSIFRQKGCVAH